MIKVAVLVTFYNGEISPFEQSALECALEMENAQVSVVSMSPMAEKERLEYLTRLGVDAVLISDKSYAGSDTLVTSKILSKYFTLNKYDLIMCGKQSLKGDTAQIPGQLSVNLGYKFIPYVMGFNDKRLKTRLGEFDLELPSVVSVEKIKTLRFPSIFSKKKDVKIVDNSILSINENEVGLIGSPTKVLKTFKNEREKKNCEFVEWQDLEELILDCLKRKNNVQDFNRNKEKFDKVYFVGEDVQATAENISNRAIRLNQSGLDLVDEIIENDCNIVLFPASLEYRALAPQIAAKLNVGLCADCIKLEKLNERLVMYRPALSGDTIAKIVSDSKYQLATVRTKKNSDKIVFGVGYGVLNRLDCIKDLAKKYNAELVASRKLVDNSNIDYSLQVGLTGKIIAPKVYVAFGISGAIQHIVGVENAETIIAINCDKDAKIFDYADYGIIKNI